MPAQFAEHPLDIWQVETLRMTALYTMPEIYFHVYSPYFLSAFFYAALHIAWLLVTDEGRPSPLDSHNEP
jgi:hypothetical protein